MSKQQSDSKLSYRATTILLGILLLGVAVVGLSLSMGVGAAAEDTDPGSDVYDIDADHGLDDADAIAEYEASGVASGEVDGLDATLSISERKGGVGIDGYQRPADALHDFVEIEYREDISRTLRIWIPEAYVTPYTRESVRAVESDHVGTYLPSREGEYLQIVVHVDGAESVVLPTHKHSELTYSVIRSYEDRVESVTGGDREWQYLDRDELEQEHAVEVEVEDVDDVVVQHDGLIERPEERWITTPRSAEGPEGVYWYAPESGDGETLYVVTKGDDAPDVRVMEGGGIRERAKGEANDARHIVDRVRKGAEDPLEWLF